MLSEFFNSSINVIEVVFNGRVFVRIDLFGPFGNDFDGSSVPFVLISTVVCV